MGAVEIVIIVIVAVLLAAAVAYVIYRKVSGKGGCCGGGCSSCSCHSSCKAPRNKDGKCEKCSSGACRKAEGDGADVK